MRQVFKFLPAELVECRPTIDHIIILLIMLLIILLIVLLVIVLK